MTAGSLIIGADKENNGRYSLQVTMLNDILPITYTSDFGMICMNRALLAVLFVFLLIADQPQLEGSLTALTAHPAEAFETVVSLGVGSVTDALIIDGDGAVWDRMIESYEANELQWSASQADAVWNVYWVNFLLDEGSVLWACGGTPDAPSGIDTGEYPAGYVRDWTPVLENVVTLDSNSTTTAVLQADGTLWAWGMLPGGAMSYTPIRIAGGVRAFSHAGYAVKTDNTLYMWSGRSETGKILCTEEPVMQDIARVKGEYAIGLDGTLWKLSADLPPQKVMDNAASIMDDGGEICALDRSGGLWCWPSGDWSQPRKISDNCAYIVRRGFEDVQAALFIDENNTLNAVYWGGKRAGEVIPLEADVLYAVTGYDRVALYIKMDGSLWLMDFAAFAHGGEGESMIPTGNLSPDAPRVPLMDKVKIS